MIGSLLSGVAEAGKSRLDAGVAGSERSGLLFDFEGFGRLAIEEKSFRESIENFGDGLRGSLNGVPGKRKSFSWISEVGIAGGGVEPGKLVFGGRETGLKGKRALERADG